MKQTIVALLITLSFLVGACSSKAQDQAQQPVIELLDPSAFWSSYEEMNDKAFLLDCRTPGEVSRGALPGANNIDFTAADFKDKVSLLDKSEPVYVYCQAGGRSAKAAALLHELGFSKVVDMKGGYQAYQNSTPK